MEIDRLSRFAGRSLALLIALAAGALPVAAQTSSAPHKMPVAPPTALPPLPPAVIDDTLQIGGADIAAKKVETRMTVALKLNGAGPFHFVVDSGADSTVVGLRAAQALRLPPGTPVMLHGTTSSSVVGRVVVDELDLGESVIRDLQLALLRDQDIGADGLIGINALVEQRLMMDFEKRVITIEDARKPAPRMDGEIVVTARRQRGQLILTQASAVGRPVDAVIDTGSQITIGNLALRDKLIRHNSDKFKPIAITGVTGVTVNLQLARIGELRVGSIILRDVPMAFADVPPFAVFGLKDKPALLLGTDFLEKFRRVSLDFGARKVRFQLRRCKADSVRVGTSSSLTRISLSGDGGEICRR